MNNNSEKTNEGGTKMEFIGPIAVLVVYFILQAWVLPRFGVKT
jgi:hypothetical protein